MTIASMYLGASNVMGDLKDTKVQECVDIELGKLIEKEGRINILLAGPKGTGKTSFIKLFLAQITGYLDKVMEDKKNGVPVTDFNISKFEKEGDYVLSKWDLSEYVIFNFNKLYHNHISL